MTKDRPDVYSDMEIAVEEISTAMDELREDDEHSLGSLLFTSYVLTRIVDDDDGTEEFVLSRKISGMLYVEDEGVSAYGYHSEINLPQVDDLDGLEDDEED